MRSALHSQKGSPVVAEPGQSSSSLRKAQALPQQHRGKAMGGSWGATQRKFRGQTPKRFLQNTDTAGLVRETLRESYSDERAVSKAIAEDTGMSPKAAENWLAGDNPMSLTAFLNAYHNNPRFKAWARKLLLGDGETDPSFQAELSAFIRAVQQRGDAG